ncbi:MAG: Uncharacterised protein [Cellulomonadaceae bacterium TMED98]|nr:MAG: Uncharacterised protein [Cellulomonadaceae bacterium TMED98]
MFHVIDEAVVIPEAFCPLFFSRPVIFQRDLQTFIQKSHLLEPGPKCFVIELGGFKHIRTRPKPNRCPRLIGGLALCQRCIWLAPVVALRPHRSLAPYFNLKPLRQGVDHTGAHTVQSPGNGIAATAELSTRMQGRENYFNGGTFLHRVIINWNATAVVGDLNAPITQNLDGDGAAMSRKRLVH